MRSRFGVRLLAGAVIAAVAGVAIAAQAQTPAPSVRVVVDGQPAAFDVPPVMVSGRVLVPLRGVFERLGAVVTWDPATQTVLAARGETTMSLRVGNPVASVNGQPTTMDVPAILVGGRTMVPLRFVSQALGASVGWDPSTTTVQISSQGQAVVPGAPLPPSQNYPAPQPPVAPAPTSATVSGTAVTVNATAVPGQIMVQTGNAVYTYSVAPTTSIIRINSADNTGGSAAFADIRPGDFVEVTADPNGVAQSIHASFKQVTGKVLATTGAGVVVLENGDSYHLNASAIATRAGAPVAPATVHAGDTVTLRVNPQTNEVWQITIQ